jgi:hypothetical protein
MVSIGQKYEYHEVLLDAGLEEDAEKTKYSSDLDI